MSDWVNQIYSQEDVLRRVSLGLRSISGACRALGLQVLAQKLEDLAVSNYSAMDEIRRIVGDEVNRQVKAAEESAAATLRTALKVAMPSQETEIFDDPNDKVMQIFLVGGDVEQGMFLKLAEFLSNNEYFNSTECCRKIVNSLKTKGRFATHGFGMEEPWGLTRTDSTRLSASERHEECLTCSKPAIAGDYCIDHQ